MARGGPPLRPTFSLVGEGGDEALLVAFEPASAAEARRVASRIPPRLLDEFAERGSAVIPVVGVGLALSDDVGYDADVMLPAAQDAARRSSTNPDASVIVAEPGEGRQSVVKE